MGHTTSSAQFLGETKLSFQGKARLATSRLILGITSFEWITAAALLGELESMRHSIKTGTTELIPVIHILANPRTRLEG